MSYLERFVPSNVSVTTRRNMFDAQTYDVEDAHHQSIVLLLSRRSEAWHWSTGKAESCRE